MKKVIGLTVSVAVAALLFGCQKMEAPKKEEVKPPAPMAAPVPPPPPPAPAPAEQPSTGK